MDTLHDILSPLLLLLVMGPLDLFYKCKSLIDRKSKREKKEKKKENEKKRKKTKRKWKKRKEKEEEKKEVREKKYPK